VWPLSAITCCHGGGQARASRGRRELSCGGLEGGEGGDEGVESLAAMGSEAARALRDALVMHRKGMVELGDALEAC
jgi:hypothetical protein